MEPALRDWLRRRTEDIVGLAYRTACDAIRIGQWLEEVKARLPRGEFMPWVESSLPFSYQTANRYCRIAEAFGPFQSSQFENFDESALYILAQRETPPAARSHALAVVSEGRRVTRKVALDILDAHRPVAVSDRDVAEYEGRVAALRFREVEKVVTRKATVNGKKRSYDETVIEVVDQDKHTQNLEGTDLKRMAELGRAAKALVAKADLVRIEKVDDPDDIELYCITAVVGKRPRIVTSGQLVIALEELACDTREEVPLKYCPGCCKKGEGIPRSQFGNNDSLADGLMGRCRVCERARKKEMRGRGKPSREAEVAVSAPENAENAEVCGVW